MLATQKLVAQSCQWPLQAALLLSAAFGSSPVQVPTGMANHVLSLKDMKPLLTSKNTSIWRHRMVPLQVNLLLATKLLLRRGSAWTQQQISSGAQDNVKMVETENRSLFAVRDVFWRGTTKHQRQMPIASRATPAARPSMRYRHLQSAPRCLWNAFNGS